MKSKVFILFLNIIPFFLFAQNLKDTLVTYDGQKIVGDIIRKGKYAVTFKPQGTFIYEKFSINDIDSIFYKNGKHEKMIPVMPEIIKKLKKTAKADKAIFFTPLSPFYYFVSAGYQQFISKNNIGSVKLHFLYYNKKITEQIYNNINFRGGGVQLGYLWTSKEPLQFNAMSVRPKFQGFHYGPQISLTYLIFDYVNLLDSSQFIKNIQSFLPSVSFYAEYTQVIFSHGYLNFHGGIGIGGVFPFNLTPEERKKVYFTSEKIAYFKYISSPLQFYGGVTFGFFF
ncbi:MAG: hypothetical protein N2Z72_02895 [Bacteroidales bacterium]|nr:hypothetical protein [Bacteroidales bacterium]